MKERYMPVRLYRNGFEYVRVPVSKSGQETCIIINPNIQFGDPVIEGTRVPAEVIANFFEAGDSVERLAKLYSLPAQQIQDCIDYVFAEDPAYKLSFNPRPRTEGDGNQDDMKRSREETDENKK